MRGANCNDHNNLVFILPVWTERGHDTPPLTLISWPELRDSI